MPDGTAYDPYPGQTSTTGGPGSSGNSNNTGYNWSGYAEWLAKTKNSTKTCNLIVNYYANGYNGSAAENPPPSSVRSYTGQSVDVRLVVEVASGDTMSNPGYVFVGWATSNNTPTITYNPGDTITNSWAAGYRGNSVTNLYAVWTNQNVITYNPDDNSIEKSAIYQVKQSGQSATLKGATFTRTGYTQTGWATTAGGPKVYDLGGTYSSNNPLSLYPVWQANTYTITYVANEGTGTMADQTVTYDSTFTPRACSFTREGYSFSSWNESQDGKGIRWKVQEYTVDRAENITLYAIWKGNEYTVYYDDNYSRYSDEITGDIVTFESEYAQPLKKVEVSLSPIQDLHGYANPWPAGGGVNVLDDNIKWTAGTYHGLQLSTQNGYEYTLTGTATEGSTIITNIIAVGDAVILPPGTYIGNAGAYELRDAAGNFLKNQYGGTPFTRNEPFYVRRVYLEIVSGRTYNVTNFIGLAKGSTALAAYSPYSNICPITGRTGLSVYRTGINIWDEEWERGTIGMTTGAKVDDNTKIRSKNYVPISPNTAYYYKFPGNWRMVYFDSDKNVVEQGNTYSPNIILTSPATAHYLLFALDATTEYDNNIAINYPATDHDYHAYNGNTYSSDWTSQAGTVYGGTLDAVTGELVVDRGCVNVSSSWYWNKSGSYPGGFYVDIQNAGTGQKKNTPFICSHAKTATSISQYVQGTCFCDGSISIRIMDGSDTVQDWEDYINAQSAAGTPIQICYELATPLTYQLTPTQVEALVGTNNVWSDGGPITIVYALDEVPQNMPPSTAIFGDIFYTRRNQLSRFGLTFKGWNTVPDGSGEAWLPSGVSMGTYKRTEDAVWNVSHNVTLYAQWDPNVYPFGTVFFNGRNAQDLGIIVEELPSYYYAERAFNHKQVNGKNGDVILDTGRYENVKKVYKVACYDPSRNFYESAVALSTFLHSAGSDYIRLEDSYEPSSYRMAIYEETNEIENLLGKAGRCEITFNCMPQRFLLSGDEEITIPSSGYSIYNPTAFDAKPMIRIQGTGTVTINGRSVQVTENDNDMLVDCENQNAKDLSGADMNYFIYCDEFPILKPGFNTISYTETIDAVKITPRWWIL